MDAAFASLAIALAGIALVGLIWAVVARLAPARDSSAGTCAGCGDRVEPGEELCEECLWHWAIK